MYNTDLTIDFDHNGDMAAKKLCDPFVIFRIIISTNFHLSI